MKTKIKRIMSALLCAAMLFAFCMPVNSASESNSLGVKFTVALDTPQIFTSNEDQTIIMRLKSNQAITVDGIGFTVTKENPLIISNITGGTKIGEYDSIGTNLENGKASWGSNNLENVSSVSELAVITITVPANTPSGTYNIGIKNLELTKDYASDIWESGASAQTTLTITEQGQYTAGLSTYEPEATVDQNVTVNIDVFHNIDTFFAAAEITVEFDPTKLSFDKNASELGNAAIEVDNGTIRIADYGTDKPFGAEVYSLSFTVITSGTAEVKLTSAAFINKANASASDLLEASITNGSINFALNKKSFPVTLPDIFAGSQTAVDGEDYTFTLKDGINYDYSNISASINGVNAEVIDNGDGSYTIKNVSGNIIISGIRTEKSYPVEFIGNASAEVTDASPTATYNTNYSFTVPSVDNWAYSIESITINGAVYTGYSVENSTCIIPGTAINGNIVIKINKVQTEASVTVEGNGAGAASGYEVEAIIGSDYTLTINPEKGYNYTVSATIAGTAVEVIDNGNYTYTVKNVSGNIVFVVARSVIVSGVSISKYLTVDGSVFWLIKNDVELDSNKISMFDGNTMFWSDEYNAYCYLVVAGTLTLDDVTEKISIAEGNATAVDYGKDVNCTGKIDASDAQLVYNMYNAMYSDFTANETMEKFLRADVNLDGKIDVNDAVAIINHIINK